jgi:hypothetical protein
MDLRLRQPLAQDYLCREKVSKAQLGMELEKRSPEDGVLLRKIWSLL